MNPIEKFREAVKTAITAAAAAGVESRHLHRVLLDLAGLDPVAASEAAEALDSLIDGQEDDLAEQLAPARDQLRRAAGE